MTIALVLALGGPTLAGPATRIIIEAPTIEAECRYLLDQCVRGRAARAAHRGYVEHPSGVVFATTSPAATLHIGNAVEAAAIMREKHGAPPDCVRQCDDLLRR